MPLDRDLPKREILPIPDRAYTGEVWYGAKDSNAGVMPPILPIVPPEGAPNVLVILVDDVGFGASEVFGGPIRTAAAKKLAEKGLKYTRFHTTALCAPTRAALLTGRNHHSVGMGTITEVASSAPGYTSMIPNTAATVAKVLRYNGYATAHFGKCHEIPVWETSPVGPFDRWPTYMGFDKFYGFVGGETNQYAPTLYDGTEYIPLPDNPTYHLTTDLADQAIKWVETVASLTPDKPFFMYFAPGAAHAPHQVPVKWSNEYSGQFDGGWDELRRTTFEAQKALRVIPEDALLPDRPDEIDPWEEMPEDLKPALRREMEVYAGFLEHTDHEVGRLITRLEELGLLDNTIVIYILGDNGASAEGTHYGSFNEMINFNGNPPEAHAEDLRLLREEPEKLGTPEAYNHYAVGWAHAMCTPYKWTKQVASHFGGTRNGMIVQWPKGIPQGAPKDLNSGLRHQFTHVIDVFPTLLEAIGLPEPVCVEGVQQKPLEGVSFFYTFQDAKAKDRHKTQYFEMFGNRGIYNNGWTAITKHSLPWELAGGTPLPDFRDDEWELYYTYDEPDQDPGVTPRPQVDWTQANDLTKLQAAPSDLATTYEKKLQELKDLWAIEAARYNVFPLDDRKIERIAERPPFVKGDVQTYSQGMYVPDTCVIDTFNRSFSIKAGITVEQSPARGAILVRGNNFGGYGLYLDSDEKLTFAYNYLGLTVHYVRTFGPIPSGTTEVEMRFTYQGGNSPGGGGSVALFCNNQPMGIDGTNQIPHTAGYIFNTDAFLMVGVKTGAPLCPELAGDNRFTGKVNWAKIELLGNPSLRIALQQRVFTWLAIT